MTLAEICISDQMSFFALAFKPEQALMLVYSLVHGHLLVGKGSELLERVSRRIIFVIDAKSIQP